MEDAYLLLKKSIADDSLASAEKYVMAGLFFNSSFSKNDLDSAYHYILESINGYKLTEPKEQQTLRNRGFNPELFSELKADIEEAGFKVWTRPAGAFYIYADCSAISDDSLQLCDTLLHEAGVAVTPGLDFGSNKSNQYVRFSYANTVENLRQGMRRIQHAMRNQ